jgi:hypothetical protein
VQVYGGKVGGTDATLVHSAIGNTTFATAQVNGETWYYFAIITQADGNKIITAPIWVTTEIPLLKNDFKLKAKEENGVVVLDWKMDTTLVFSHFIVEVSRDGKNFTAKATVPAVTGQRDYLFTDMTPYDGVSFYRITMVGVKGELSYSGIVMMDVKKAAVLTIYPNPASTTLTVKTSDNSATLLVQMIDAAGNMVYNKTMPAATSFTLDLSKFQNGYYVLRVNNEITRLIISK